MVTLNYMSFFNDASCYREITQWRAVFNTPSLVSENAQLQPLFANFGSICADQDISSSDKVHPCRDLDAISRRIAEQFAMDVFVELRGELQPESRSIQTSHTDRKAATTMAATMGMSVPKLREVTVPTHRTPNVTPHNSRKGLRNHSILQPKEKSYF